MLLKKERVLRVFTFQQRSQLGVTVNSYSLPVLRLTSGDLSNQA
jgi:hypothetical protein